MSPRSASTSAAAGAASGGVAKTPPSASPPVAGQRETFIWSLTLREAIFLALIAALIFLGKYFTRIPIHVPGHSGVIWIALMVVGRGLVNKRGAGLLMGLVAGALVTFAVPGREGIFEWTKYAAAGAVLDLLVWALGNDLLTWWKAILAGAGAHLAKLVGATLLALVLGLPLDVVAVGLGLAATTHLVFGALGGLLGWTVLVLLRGVPELRRQM